MNALRIVSAQPDLFCIGNPANNAGGPFCHRCGRGIDVPNGQSWSVAWCYYCGLETGAQPAVEIPLYWSKHETAFTFDEVQRMRKPGFDPLTDLATRYQTEGAR